MGVSWGSQDVALGVLGWEVSNWQRVSLTLHKSKWSHTEGNYFEPVFKSYFTKKGCFEIKAKTSTKSYPSATHPSFSGMFFIL